MSLTVNSMRILVGHIIKCHIWSSTWTLSETSIRCHTGAMSGLSLGAASGVTLGAASGVTLGAALGFTLQAASEVTLGAGTGLMVNHH